MAGGHEPHDDPSLKGLSRYFNNKTIRGRANVSLATFSFLGLLLIYKKFSKNFMPSQPECLCDPNANLPDGAARKDECDEPTDDQKCIKVIIPPDKKDCDDVSVNNQDGKCECLNRDNPQNKI